MDTNNSPTEIRPEFETVKPVSPSRNFDLRKLSVITLVVATLSAGAIYSGVLQAQLEGGENEAAVVETGTGSSISSESSAASSSSGESAAAESSAASSAAASSAESSLSAASSSESDSSLSSSGTTLGIAWNADRDAYRAGDSATVRFSLFTDTRVPYCGDVTVSYIDPALTSHIISEASGLELPDCSLEPGSLRYLFSFSEIRPVDYTFSLPLAVVGDYAFVVRKGDQEILRTTLTATDDEPLLRVLRAAPARLFPDEETKMRITVIPQQSFRGTVTEQITNALPVSNDDGLLTSEAVGDVRLLTWEREWEEGKEYSLWYAVTPTEDSPLTLTTGPLEAKGIVVTSPASSSTSEAPAEEASSSDSSSLSSEEASSSDSSSSTGSGSSLSSSSGSIIEPLHEATESSSSAHSSVESSSSDSSAISSESSAPTLEVTPTPEDDDTDDGIAGSNLAGFLGSPFRFVYSLFSTEETALTASLADSESSLRWTEARTWQFAALPFSDVVLEEEPTEEASSSSSSSISSSTSSFAAEELQLTPTKNIFDAEEAPKFVMLHQSADNGTIAEGDPLPEAIAFQSIARATLSDEDIVKSIIASTVGDRSVEISDGIVGDSAALNDLRNTLNIDATGPGAIEDVTDAVSQKVETDTALQDALAQAVITDDGVRSALVEALTPEVKQEISDAIAAHVVSDSTATMNIGGILGETATENVGAAVVTAIREHVDIADAITAATQEESSSSSSSAASEDSSFVTVMLTNAAGKDFYPNFHFEKGSVILVVEPEREFAPGKYTLAVIVRNPLTGEMQTIMQDFLWGVLAMNPVQDRYRPGETADIAFGVLDDHGEIVCDADLTLEVTTPSGTTLHLSTADGSIVVTGSCGEKQSDSVSPDYRARVALDEEGIYEFQLTAITANGERTLDSSLSVTSNPSIIVSRTAATRLFPVGLSPMIIRVDFLRNFSGTIRDIVPDGFEVSQISQEGTVQELGNGSGSTISWTGSWSSGESVELTYMYDAPDISPQFYLIGPLLLQPNFFLSSEEQELRSWQIANDAIKTWDGGGADTEWTTCANWNLDTCPATTDSVVFDGTSTKNVNIGTNTTTAAMTISSGYTGTITIGSSVTLTVTGNYTQADGIFNGSAGSLIAGGFVMSNGTFTAPGSGKNFIVYGSFSQTGSPTFDANGGTLTLGNGVVVNASTSISAPGLTFNKVVINKATTMNCIVYIFTIAAGTTLPLGADPTTTFTNTQNAGCGQAISNSGTITGSGTWTLNATGGFTNSTTGVISGSFSLIDSNHGGGFVNAAGASISSSVSPMAMTVEGSLVIQSGSTFPSGANVTMNGFLNASTTLNAPGVTFNQVTISKTASSNCTGYTFTIAANTTAPLGNSPTTSLSNFCAYGLTNNGTITVGSGTWTLNLSPTTSSVFTNNGTLNLGTSAWNASLASIVNTGTLNLGTSAWTSTAASISNSGTITGGSGTWTSSGNITNSGTISTGFTTLDINSGRSFTNSGVGAFTNSVTPLTVNIEGTLTVPSGTTFPTGANVNFDGTVNADTGINAPAATLNKVTLNKIATSSTTTTFTISAGTTVPLGDSPTVSLSSTNYGTSAYQLVNNGTITGGTGTWTINATAIGLVNNGAIATSYTTLNIDNGGYSGSAGSTFTMGTTPTIQIERSLAIVSGGTFPTGAIVQFDGNVGVSVSVSAPGITFGRVIITKPNVINSTALTFTIAAGTTIPLGDSPTINLMNSGYSGSAFNLVNNGTITGGTGTMTATINNGALQNYGAINTSYTAFSFSNSGFTNASSSATFTSGSTPTFTIQRSLTGVAGSTFPSDATINFTGSTDSNDTFDVPASYSFTGVTITKSKNSTTSSTFTIGATTTAPLGNSPTVTLTNAQSGTVSLVNNGTITVGTGTWTYTTDGTFTNAGTVRTLGTTSITGLTNDTARGTWEYRGDGDGSSDTYTLKDFGTSDYYNLIINMTDAADVVQLGGALRIAGTLTVQSGTLSGNGQTGTVVGATTISGGTYSAGSALQTLVGGLTVSGGTFTGSTGAVSAYNLNLSSGTVTAPSSSFTLFGSWSQTGGTFNHNNGSVVFEGSGSIIGTSSFNDLSFNTRPLSKLHWRFDETSAGSTVQDSSGNANNGTAAGAGGSNNLPQPSATVPSLAFGNPRSLSFDGTDDSVNLSSFTQPVYAASLWFRTSSTINSSSSCVSLFSTQAISEGTYVTLGSCTLLHASEVITVVNGTNRRTVVADISITGNTWHNLIINWDAATSKYIVYLDGVAQTTVAATGGHASLFSSTQFTIGSYVGASSFFAGNIDDVRIYSTPLSAYQISKFSSGQEDDTLSYALGSDITAAGTIKILNGSFNPVSRNVTAAGVNVQGGTFGSGASLTVSGPVTLTGGTLHAPRTGTMTVSGNWLKKSAATFRYGSGTVTLNGTNQTMSGSTTFWNLSKSVTSAATLTLAATTTQTVRNTLTLLGDTGQRLSLRSTQTGTQAKLDPQSARNVGYLDVKDNQNLNAESIVCSNDCINSGNLTNWSFPVSITVYNDTGVTPTSSGISVAVSINGGSPSTATTNSLGIATFASLPINDGDYVAMWIDNGTMTGATITRSNQTLLGFSIYKKHLILQHENGSTLTNANIASALPIGQTNLDDVFTLSSGILTMPSDSTLYIKSGSTYAPGNTVNAKNLIVAGTFAMSTSAVNVSGNWDSNSGTFSGSNTVTFTGSGTIRRGNSSFSTLTINAAGQTIRPIGSLSGSTINISAGTLNLSGASLTVRSAFRNDATLRLRGSETLSFTNDTAHGGTVIFDGSDTYSSLNGITNFANLTLSGTGLWSLNGTTTVGGNLLITAGTLRQNGKALSVSGNWTNSGTRSGTGTVTFAGNGTVTEPGGFHNVTVNAAASTVTLGAPMSISGALTITAGTLDVSASSHRLTLSGSLTNNGTFNPRSGLVNLVGGDQTLSGSTTFYDLRKKVTSAATLTFQEGTTQTIQHRWSASGTSLSAMLSLRSSDTVDHDQWNINPQGSRAIGYLDVQDSNNTNASAIVCSVSCQNSGNLNNWTFPIAVTVYSDTGSTHVGAGVSVALSVNGDAKDTATTDSDGTASFTETQTDAGDLLVAWINSGTMTGATITRTNGATLGVDVYQKHLIVRHDQGSSLTSANISSATPSGETNLEAVYTLPGGVVTAGTGSTMLIPTGKTFIPGAALNVYTLKNNGTLTMGSNAVTVRRNWDSSVGTFTGTNTVTFTGSGTIQRGSSPFGSVVINNSGKQILPITSLTTVSGLTITAGTLNLSGASLTVGGTFRNDATLRMHGSETISFTNDIGHGGTIFFDGNGTYSSLNGIEEFANLTLSGSGLWTLANPITVSGNLTLSRGTLTQNNKSITVSGNWTNTNGTRFGSGMVFLTGNGTVTEPKGFKGLTINAAASTVTLGSPITVSGSLTIANGTLDVSVSNHRLTVGGNWANNGSFTERSGTVNLNGDEQSIFGSSTFYDLTKVVSSGATLTFEAGSTQTVTNEWTAEGSDEHLLLLRSSVEDTEWNIDPENTRTLSFVDVQDSHNDNASTILCSDDCISSGNNTNWAFPMVVRVQTSTGVTLGAGITVTAKVNNGSLVTSTTNSLGIATFNDGNPSHDLVGLNNGELLTLTSQGVGSSGALITRTNGSTLSFIIRNNTLAVQREDGSALTNSDIETAAGYSNLTSLFTLSGSVVKHLAMNENSNLWVSGPYTPTTKVYADNVRITGNLNMTTQNFTVEGDWDATDGTFSGNNMTYFKATREASIVSNGNFFHDVTFVVNNGSNWTTVDSFQITGTQYIIDLSTEDHTAPIISSLDAEFITTTSAIITWDTNEVATSLVSYGTDPDSLDEEATPANPASLNMHHVITLSGLEPGTTYYYNVTSVDTWENEATSGTLEFETEEFDTAGPVISNTATGSLTATSILVSWDTNESSTGAVLYGTDPLALTEVATPTSPNSLNMHHAITLSGLEPATEYYFKISTTDTAGNVTIGNTHAFETEDIDDDAPFISNDIAGLVGTTTAQISWDTDEVATEEVRYGTDGETFDTSVNGGGRFNMHHVLNLADLTPNTQYYFYVISADAVGNTASGSVVSFVTSSLDLTPPTISDTATGSLTTTSVRIFWSTDETATGAVLYGTDSNDLSSVVAGTGFNMNHAFTVTGLDPGTQYYFQVSATDDSGNVSYDTVRGFLTESLDTTGPVVSDEAASLVTSTGAVLTWSTNEGATTLVEYGTDSGDLSSTASMDTFDNSHYVILESLAASTTYYYQITATDESSNATTTSVGSFSTSEESFTQEDIDEAVAAAEEAATAAAGGGAIFRWRDLQPPTLTKVTVTPEENGAVVTWETDERSTSLVRIGKETPTERGIFDTSSLIGVTEHSVTLTNLTPGTTYTYVALSYDIAGNAAMTEEQTFTTLGEAPAGESDSSSSDALHEAAEEEPTGLDALSAALDKVVAIAKTIEDEIPGAEYRLALQNGVLSLKELARGTLSPVYSTEPKLEFLPTAVRITWTTDVEGNSLVSYAPESEYMKTGDYLQTSGKAMEDVFEHTVMLYGLTPGTRYHYQARTVTAVGTESVSPDLTFTTPQSSVEILTYKAEILDGNTARFSWTTSSPTTTAVTATPYRDGIRVPEQEMTEADAGFGTSHSITMNDFDPSTYYEIELWGTTPADLTVSKVISRFVTAKDGIPLEVFGIQTNSALLPGKDSRVQAVVSWTTNVSATSRVAFQKGISSDPEKPLTNVTPDSVAYARKHVVVLPNLDPGTVYSFHVESRDSAGNEVISRTYTMLTPREEENIFHVILNQVQSIFGWVNQLRT